MLPSGLAAHEHVLNVLIDVSTTYDAVEAKLKRLKERPETTLPIYRGRGGARTEACMLSSTMIYIDMEKAIYGKEEHNEYTTRAATSVKGARALIEAGFEKSRRARRDTNLPQA